MASSANPAFSIHRGSHRVPASPLTKGNCPPDPPPLPRISLECLRPLPSQAEWGRGPLCSPPQREVVHLPLHATLFAELRAKPLNLPLLTPASALQPSPVH